MYWITPNPRTSNRGLTKTNPKLDPNQSCQQTYGNNQSPQPANHHLNPNQAKMKPKPLNLPRTHHATEPRRGGLREERGRWQLSENTTFWCKPNPMILLPPYEGILRPPYKEATKKSWVMSYEQPILSADDTSFWNWVWRKKRSESGL